MIWFVVKYFSALTYHELYIDKNENRHYEKSDLEPNQDEKEKSNVQIQCTGKHWSTRQGKRDCRKQKEKTQSKQMLELQGA